jgi:hypothetical protein
MALLLAPEPSRAAEVFKRSSAPAYPVLAREVTQKRHIVLKDELDPN